VHVRGDFVSLRSNFVDYLFFLEKSKIQKTQESFPLRMGLNPEGRSSDGPKGCCQSPIYNTLFLFGWIPLCVDSPPLS